MFAKIQHQVRAIDPLERAVALQFTHPNHGHSIGRSEQRTVEDVAKNRIVLCLAHAMHVRNSDITAATLADGVEQELASSRLVEHADPDTQDVYFLYLGHAAVDVTSRALR